MGFENNQSNGIKFDPSSINQDMVNNFRLTMDPNAIPDLGNMLVIINELLMFIETEDMQKLEKSDRKEFERRTYTKYNNDLPMKIIGLMLEDDRYDHLSRLLDMFDVLNDVKKGKKDMQKEYESFNEKLNESYLYPAYGGKEGFEKAMQEGVPKNKKRKNKNKK